MLAIGRAFMSGRKIMLLDEPSMGLAPLLMLNVFEALKEINQEGTTILLVEQNAAWPLSSPSAATYWKAAIWCWKGHQTSCSRIRK